MSDSPIADMVEKMLSGGIPPEMIVLAVRTAELATSHSDPAAERRRYLDRERKRRAAKSGIPPETKTRSALSFLSKKELNKESKKEVAKRNRGRKLPDDWVPKPKHFDQGRELGFSSADVLGQAEDMRLWARSNEHRAVARKTDWDLTFSGWMRRNKPKGAAASPIAITGPPAYLTPPPGCQSLEEIRAQQAKSNGKIIRTEIRDNAGVGADGPYRPEKLQLPG